jgi:16S rRNA (guanine(966)-N(2))-methyltransferase RsmD
MRVIAGKAGGTRLVSLKGASLRPTLDRVKESVFNRIGPSLDGETFLDLFAGSGSIGIEALSRGAEKVVFGENNHRAQHLIYANLEKCRFGIEGIGAGEKDWVLLKSDALHVLHILQERGYCFDWIYVDPPFQEELYEECLLQLSGSGVLKDTGTVIVEHYHKNILQKNYGKLILQYERRLGDTLLSYFILET